MKTSKLTKSEKAILDLIVRINAAGALCGLGGSNPKFIERLQSKGLIEYVESPGLGRGWQLKQGEKP